MSVDSKRRILSSRAIEGGRKRTGSGSANGTSDMSSSAGGAALPIAGPAGWAVAVGRCPEPLP
jgi:hypothetical protein